jgi:alginate O-acetyltransferase complex protein AlgI
VFFRADTLPGAIAFLKAMSGFSPAAPTPYLVTWYLTPELWLALTAGAIGSMPIGPTLASWEERRSESAWRPLTRWSLAFGGVAMMAVVLVASIVQIAARTYNPFIYFRF